MITDWPQMSPLFCALCYFISPHAVWCHVFDVQCPVMKYHRELLISILHSRVSVADALSVQVIGIEAAPDAYKRFSNGEAVKFVLDPSGLLRSLGKAGPAPAEEKVHE